MGHVPQIPKSRCLLFPTAGIWIFPRMLGFVNCGYGGSELELDFTQMVLRMAYVLRRPQRAYIIYPSNTTLPDPPLPLPSPPQPQAVYISPELGAK